MSALHEVFRVDLDPQGYKN